ncbi:MAG: 50S ribosomal protein L24 [Anaerolineae bacterium]
MVQKIRRDDTIEVISGDHTGERGKVMRVMPKEHRVVVQGVNMVKKHQRRTRQSDGGIIEREAPLHVSNVALVCPRCDAPHRVGIVTRDDGTRRRFCKKCNEVIE